MFVIFAMERSTSSPINNQNEGLKSFLFDFVQRQKRKRELLGLIGKPSNFHFWKSVHAEVENCTTICGTIHVCNGTIRKVYSIKTYYSDLNVGASLG
jgi:hypothetical protein